MGRGAGALVAGGALAGGVSGDTAGAGSGDEERECELADDDSKFNKASSLSFSWFPCDSVPSTSSEEAQSIPKLSAIASKYFSQSPRSG